MSHSLQVLEEPGEDTTKFDSIVPTTVKPRTSEEFKVESALEGHVRITFNVMHYPYSLLYEKSVHDRRRTIRMALITFMGSRPF